jgi:hypothetical protein
MAYKRVEFTDDQWWWLNRVCLFHIQETNNEIARWKTKQLMKWLSNFHPEPTPPVSTSEPPATSCS